LDKNFYISKKCYFSAKKETPGDMPRGFPRKIYVQMRHQTHVHLLLKDMRMDIIIRDNPDLERSTYMKIRRGRKLPVF